MKRVNYKDLWDKLRTLAVYSPKKRYTKKELTDLLDSLEAHSRISKSLDS